jgi:translocation protein SEC63
LTDEKVRAKCEKYGNPDGPGSFSVAVALPAFLIKRENHVAVLSVFFLILLVLIPGLAILWYTDQAKYDSDGILLENK